MLSLLTRSGAQAQPRDSVTVPASLQYHRPGIINRIILGKNYRDIWEQPVRMPVFHLKAQGFRIKELGGGNQTLSLQLADRQGRSWVLRTVDKTVDGALPPLLRKTFVVTMVQQQISGAHPYAPLVVSRLSKVLGVPSSDPAIYFVPDDPDLDSFRQLFAGTVCLLEQREPGEIKPQTTERVLGRIIDESSVRPDGPAVLRARMLDLLVGDWDRHAGQWRWGNRATHRVQPLPRDRDQAFYYNNGVLPRFLQTAAFKYLVSFSDDLHQWRGTTYKSWPFDRFFLSEVDGVQTKMILTAMQASLTDSVLADAVKALPPEIFALNGKTLLRQLQGRRDELVKYGMKYYRFLSGYVDVYGSDKDEEFVVRGGGDSLQVQVFALQNGRPGRLLYDRHFKREDTRLLRFWSFHGSDRIRFSNNDLRFAFELYDDEGDDEILPAKGNKIRKVPLRRVGVR